MAASQSARSFYLDPNGNDAGDGMSVSNAWRSIQRLNREDLKPGDQIIFAEGAEFEGSISLKSSDAGTADQPIHFSSHGKPATIISPDATGFTASTGGIEIDNLRFEGQAKDKKKGYMGVAFIADGKPGEKYQHLIIKNVEVSGFGDTGIGIGSVKHSGAGYAGVQITGCHCHDNFGTGIATWDDASTTYAHENFIIRDCLLENNRSGTGAVISGVDGCVFSDCRAVGNTGEGGGVGLWAYSARNVQFLHCISCETRSKGGDGGGFDLDGGCVDCVIEDCLAYENDGPGYMHCDYPTAHPTHGNVMRHCVSVNDGRKVKGDNVGFGFVTWGSGLDNCVIENNRCYVTTGGNRARRVGALFVTYIGGSQGKGDKLHILTSVFRGNEVQIQTPGMDFVDDNSPADLASGVRFDGNAYFDSGDEAAFTVSGNRFENLAIWKMAGHDQDSQAAKHMPELGNYRLTSTTELDSFKPLDFGH